MFYFGTDKNLGVFHIFVHFYALPWDIYETSLAVYQQTSDYGITKLTTRSWILDVASKWHVRIPLICIDRTKSLN